MLMPENQEPQQLEEAESRAPAQEPERKPEPEPTPPAKPETDWKAEARKWEQRAKENAAAKKRIDELEAQNQSAQERAEAAAKAAEDRARAAVERMAASEIRAALTGIVDDPKALVEDINLRKFITEDGDVDDEAVKALRGRYEKLIPKGPRSPAPNPAQGSSGKPPQSFGERIAAAEKNGDIKTALRLKSEQLLANTQG